LTTPPLPPSAELAGPKSAASAAAASSPSGATAAAVSTVPTVLQAEPVAPWMRTTGEEQWFLAKETRKAANRRLDETPAAVQKLAVQRHALVKRLDRQHTTAEATHKDAKRHLNRAMAAMRSLSEVLFDAED